MKKCFKCGAEKPYAEFYRHAKMADGYIGKCKCCTKADVKERRATNPAVQEYDRKRGSRRTPEMEQAYREKYPLKYKAKNAVNNAVRDGRLVKADACEDCGSTFALHGHHDDYTKPLEVRWLCALCHHRWHALHGEAKT